jgi:hypothetical protein
MRAALLLIMASGCFSPSPPSGLPCSPSGSCPEGQSCVLGTCGAAANDDGGSPDGATDLGSHFGVPTILGGQRLSGDQYGPSLTSDGLKMYTSAENPAGETDIYASQSNNMVFSAPLVVASLANLEDSYDPEITVDGRIRWFDSKKSPEGIWYATRVGDNFAGVSSVLPGKRGPGLADGDARLFCNDMTTQVFEEYASSPASVMMLRTHAALMGYQYPSGSRDGLEVFTMKNHQLYRATRTTLDAQFGVPERLEFDAYDGDDKDDPEISADGKTLYFSMKTPDSLGYDTYMATR